MMQTPPSARALAVKIAIIHILIALKLIFAVRNSLTQRIARSRTLQISIRVAKQKLLYLAVVPDLIPAKYVRTEG